MKISFKMFLDTLASTFLDRSSKIANYMRSYLPAGGSDMLGSLDFGMAQQVKTMAENYEKRLQKNQGPTAQLLSVLHEFELLKKKKDPQFIPKDYSEVIELMAPKKYPVDMETFLVEMSKRFLIQAEFKPRFNYVENPNNKPNTFRIISPWLPPGFPLPNGSTVVLLKDERFELKAHSESGYASFTFTHTQESKSVVESKLSRYEPVVTVIHDALEQESYPGNVRNFDSQSFLICLDNLIEMIGYDNSSFRRTRDRFNEELKKLQQENALDPSYRSGCHNAYVVWHNEYDINPFSLRYFEYWDDDEVDGVRNLNWGLTSSNLDMGQSSGLTIHGKNNEICEIYIKGKKIGFTDCSDTFLSKVKSQNADELPDVSDYVLLTDFFYFYLLEEIRQNRKKFMVNAEEVLKKQNNNLF